ncbi:hypothetical protein Tco_0227464 [Tanacetum coccineum]
MSRTNSQAEIVSEEQLVPRANSLVIKKNNQRVASDSHITDTMLRFVIKILRHHKLYKPVFLTTTVSIIYLHQFKTTINHNKNNHTFTFELDTHTFTLTPGLLRIVLQMPPPDPNNTYTKPPSKIQILEFIKTLGYNEDPETKMIAISKMVTTRLHQLWRAILSVLNRGISPVKYNGDYKFGMKVPDAMISDAIKKKVGYTYYMAKKMESEKAKIVNEPEEQHVSLVKSGELAKSFSIQEPHTQQHRWSQLTIDNQLDDTVADTYAEWGQKLKGPAIKDPAVQSLLDLWKGSKASRLESLKQNKKKVAGEGSSAAHNKYYDSSDTDSDAILYSSSLDKTKEGANETDDADESVMDLSNDNPQGDDDVVGYGVFMHNKSTATPNSYLPQSEDYKFLTRLHSNLARCASEVSLGKHVDVLATKNLLQEMFSDKNAHHIPSLPAKKIPYPTTTPQPSPLQAKAKKLMQKVKKNMRKINFKKAVAQKFREYDQKLEALTNFNVSEAFEKAVQAKVLTEIKNLLPTHIPKAVANYVRPRLNTSVLDGENKKKRQKDVGKPSSRSSRRKKSPVIHAQVNTPTIRPLDPEDEYIQARSNPEWYAAKRKTTWFDLLLKSDIDKNENHIFRPSTVAIPKKLKPIIQKDELTITDFECAGLERLKQQYQNNVELEYHVSQLKAATLTEAKWNSDEDEVSKPRKFERHMSKNTKTHPSFYNNDFYYLMCLSMKENYTTSITKQYVSRYYKQSIEDMIFDRWSKETHRHTFEALNVRRSNDKEYEFSYADLPRLSLNDVEDMYLFQVQDTLHHLLLKFVKDINNALLLFIRRVMIQNRVDDIQLRVESYQQTLNLTKPMMFFEEIDQKIPFTMSGTHKGVMYLNQHNIKYFMKLSEVRKLCDGTLIKICENLVNMVKRNKLGIGNKRLKGRD